MEPQIRLTKRLILGFKMQRALDVSDGAPDAHQIWDSKRALKGTKSKYDTLV
jgi:hypothetical protein